MNYAEAIVELRSEIPLHTLCEEVQWRDVVLPDDPQDSVLLRVRARDRIRHLSTPQQKAAVYVLRLWAGSAATHETPFLVALPGRRDPVSRTWARGLCTLCDGRVVLTNDTIQIARLYADALIQTHPGWDQRRREREALRLLPMLGELEPDRQDPSWRRYREVYRLRPLQAEVRVPDPTSHTRSEEEDEAGEYDWEEDRPSDEPQADVGLLPPPPVEVQPLPAAEEMPAGVVVPLLPYLTGLRPAPGEGTPYFLDLSEEVAQAMISLWGYSKTSWRDAFYLRRGDIHVDGPHWALPSHRGVLKHEDPSEWEPPGTSWSEKTWTRIRCLRPEEEPLIRAVLHHFAGDQPTDFVISIPGKNRGRVAEKVAARIAEDFGLSVSRGKGGRRKKKSRT